MENKITAKSFLPILLVLLVSGLFIYLGKSLLEEWNTDHRVLLVGDGLLFGVTAISFWLYIRALRNSNMHAFLRVMYGSLLVKMFVCLIATFVYASVAGRNVNRNGVLGCFILYILYTFFEVKILMQLNKKGSSKHA
ncbi:MAG: hypothetical protein JST68_09330 [Bacteroidetes bacterium]|nr:hypothetical protein [Bacteroidota bacterium]